jgi:glycerol-3-phosphate dehydrogenase
MPITAGVVAVVHRGLQPQELLERFMTRATKREVENGG